MFTYHFWSSAHTLLLPSNKTGYNVKFLNAQDFLLLILLFEELDYTKILDLG